MGFGVCGCVFCCVPSAFRYVGLCAHEYSECIHSALWPRHRMMVFVLPLWLQLLLRQLCVHVWMLNSEVQPSNGGRKTDTQTNTRKQHSEQCAASRPRKSNINNVSGYVVICTCERECRSPLAGLSWMAGRVLCAVCAKCDQTTRMGPGLSCIMASHSSDFSISLVCIATLLVTILGFDRSGMD